MRSAVTSELVTVLGLDAPSTATAAPAAEVTLSLNSHMRRVSLGHRQPLAMLPRRRSSLALRAARGAGVQMSRFAKLFPSFTRYELRQAVADFFFTPNRPRFSAPPNQRAPIVRLVPPLDLRSRVVSAYAGLSALRPPAIAPHMQRALTGVAAARGSIVLPRPALRISLRGLAPRIRFPRFAAGPVMAVGLTGTACAAVAAIAIAGFAHERAELQQARATAVAAQQLSSEQAKQLALLQYQARTLNSSVAKLEQRDRELRSMVAQQREVDDSGGDAPTSASAAQAASHSMQHPQPVHQISQAPPNKAADFQVFASVAQASTALSTMAARVLNIAHHENSVSDAMISAIPSLDPTSGGEVTSPFGYRSYPSPEYHRGIDLAIYEGHPVESSADGRVTLASWDGGFGNKIEIDHGNGYATWYGHLSRIDVSVGEHVAKGQTIGAVGETGYATGPHLHYQIMLHGVAIDPAPYLHGAPPALVAAIRTR